MHKIHIPQDVSYIIKTLEDNGYSAFIVGGCVRDSLLGNVPNDWDITTNATPEKVKELFNKTIDTGIQHGTVTVLVGAKSYEVTTFRKDGDYKDSRHPESVEYTDDLVLDLSRRDFTVNAMAYNENFGLVDPFGGISDLEISLIKCVGNPTTRFSEDALRMLRAVRFSAQLSFSIHESVISALKEKSEDILNISAERIREELNKMLLSDNSFEAFLTLYETSLLKHILPELDRCFDTEQNIKYHLYNVGIHSLYVVKNCPKKLYLKYAALFHDIGKPDTKKTDTFGIDTFRNHSKLSTELAEKVLRRLKMDNKSIDKILRLIKYHDREIVLSRKAIKRAVLDIGDDIFEDLIELKSAEVYAQNTKLTFPRLENYNEILSIYQNIKTQKEAISVAELEINGNDVMNLGFKGKDIGTILQHTLLYIITNPEENKKEKILKIIKKNANLWLKNE